MRESPFGFEYSWADLEPIRPLAVVAVACQAIGGLLGYLMLAESSIFMKIWIGAALGTLPGFFIGALVQHQIRAQAFTKNRTMVLRFLLVATLLTAIGLVMLIAGPGV